MKLKIISYNIHKGYNIGNTLYVLKEIKNALKEVDPDIVFLQEVQGDHTDPRRKVDNFRTAAQFEYLADTIWDHYTYGQNAVYPSGHHGNAILSRYPIKKWENLDLTINEWEYRGLLHAKLWLPEDKEINLFNTHINLFEFSRLKQAEIIINYIKTNFPKDAPIILGGDFNDWTATITHHIEKKLHAEEAFFKLNGKLPKTFPSFFPTLSLDRIIGKNVLFKKAYTLRENHWKKLSDHLPIVVEFEV